ncbi:MAG: ABC transporter permease [Spirochaetia bacterium]
MEVSKIVEIYTSDRRKKIGIFSTWVIMLRHMIAKRELIWQLFVRDFFVANKRSFLGSAWLFLSPIFGMISWLFLNMAGLLSPGTLNIPYPIYLLTGTMIWGLFSSTYLYTKDTLVVIQAYASQVNFPHEVILIKQILQALANTLFAFLINVIIMLAFGIVPSFSAFLLPFCLLPLILIAASIGLLVSVIKVVFPDFERILNQVFPLLMYTVPIIYSAETSNKKLALLIKYNPLTYAITVPRDVIFGLENLPWKEFFLCGIVAVVIFLLSLRIFFVTEELVIERLY